MTSDDREQLSLNDAAGRLLDECRMVLPGIQALFGFQLIAVFSARFDEVLSRGEQLLHLASILLVVLSIALVMSPAAWHRLINPRSVTERFLRFCNRLLIASMPPLAAGITLEIYLIARVISEDRRIALTLAAFAFCTLIGMWMIIPTRLRRAAR